MSRRWVVALVFGPAFALAAAACGGGEAPTATAEPAAAPVESARITELKAASEAKGLRFLTHDEIVAGARREGKLIAAPGFDDASFPTVEAAFEAAFPFIDLETLYVSGTAAGERFNFGMLAGTTEVDVLEASSDDWKLYRDNDLLIPYDYEAMARAGELAINPDAIMHTPAGQLPFFGSSINVIAYNTDMIPPDEAPKNWEDCLDPKWKGLVATDTKTPLDGLIGVWTAEEILAYARGLKENDVIFTRTPTATLVRLLSGEFPILCPTSYHASLRQLIADPSAPLGLVFTDPLKISPREQEGIYAAAKHPNAALLWMEWLSRTDVQTEVLSANDPGKASYLVEGTVSYEVLKTYEGTVHVCGTQCILDGVTLEIQIVVEAWGFPRVGAIPD